MSQQFGKKFALGQAPQLGDQKVKGPSALDDIPDVLEFTDPAAGDEQELAALEQLGRPGEGKKMADWVRSLELTPGLLKNREVQAWLGEFHFLGITKEKFNKMRDEDVCPFCRKPGCPSTQSAGLRAMGWKGGSV